MNQPRTHDDAIADVLWWMKGALAFVHSSERSTIQRMHDKLLAMREWQVRLGNEWNRVVRFGRDEKFPTAVIAVTEAELDRIGDALIVVTHVKYGYHVTPRSFKLQGSNRR